MKKIVVFLLMVCFSATLFANEHGDYVKTNQGIFFFKKIKFGINSCLVATKENGEKVKFLKSQVLAFSRDGQLFEKMPVYKENKTTGEEDFMALVCYRSGLRLYKYEYLDEASSTQFRRYYIFKGDKYVLEIDDRNKPTLTAFFNAK